MKVTTVDRDSAAVAMKAPTDLDRIQKSLGLQASVTVSARPKMAAEDQEVLTAGSSALANEDLFPPILFDPTEARDTLLIYPPYNLHALEHLTLLNNSLLSCISAYEVNIDGTGHIIERENQLQDGTVADVDSDDDATFIVEDDIIEGVNDFFKEVWPQKSLMTVRRQIRRDEETTGNGYMEVIRSISGDIVYARRLDPKFIRLVNLDAPVPVTRQVRRFGEDMEVTMPTRERRFAQASNEHSALTSTNENGVSSSTGTAETNMAISMEDARKRVVFFKEFGASRELNKRTGQWAREGEEIDPNMRATELIHFTAMPDVHTAYGVPRWINQTPSVLGSRRAEELNLDFFNSGGIPPIMVVVEGGELAQRVRENLQQYLWNPLATKHNAAIIEATQTGGQLDGTNNVRVRVERFGAERQKDSMFENYDDKCERRVRSSFRLAPIFVGRTEDYSFATAFASYVVGEVQVFKPERREFDETINGTLMREFNQKLIKEGEERMIFRSMPLQTVDAQTQIRAVNVAKDVATNESLINSINEVADLRLKPKEVEPVPEALGGPIMDDMEDEDDDDDDDSKESGDGRGPVRGPEGGPDSRAREPNQGQRSGQPAATNVSKIDPRELLTLSGEWVDVITTEKKNDLELIDPIADRVANLSGHDRIMFDSYVADSLLRGNLQTPDSTGLISAASAITSK